MKKIIICILLLTMMLSVSSLFSKRAFAAKAGEIDSHGNVVPAGREEVDNSAPHPLGWGNAPQNTKEAMKMGWSKRIPMRVGTGDVAFFWVRETEVVPKGEKPISTVHSHKLNTNVRGNTLGQDFGESGTTVDVYAHRYIYADDDFTPPSKGHNPSAGDMMAPHRGLPPYSALPVPAYSFKDEELQKKYLSTVKKAEIGTFWGSSAVADKREGQVFYCINPNAVDPVANTAYFPINTKYDYQSNY